MEMTEILLLIAGGVIFILSFLIPDKKGAVSGQTKTFAREEITELVKQEMEGIRSHVDDVVEESITYAMEKTERSLERLSNEKIMAVNEYSDTVLEQIHRNHEEAMFLYDMLNSKHTNLKNTVSEVNRTVKEAEEKVSGFQKLAPEVLQERKGRAIGDAESVFSGTEGSGEKQSAAKSAAFDTAPGQENADKLRFPQETAADGRSNNERILELYRQGKSKVAIARELGLGVGEVKLVIDLFRKQGAM